MRVVVMDKDMREPLTVVEIPASLMRAVEAGAMRVITIPVPVEFSSWLQREDVDNALAQSLRRCNLRMEPIWTGDSRTGRRVLYWNAIPDDEELALLLRAAFLPGQMTELRRREVEAWIHGAFGAPLP